jgi:hypothetical protein
MEDFMKKKLEKDREKGDEEMNIKKHHLKRRLRVGVGLKTKLVAGLILSSIVAECGIGNKYCWGMLDKDGKRIEADVSNSVAMTKEEAVLIARSGIQDGVGNVLALNLGMNHSLVLISQLTPGVFEVAKEVAKEGAKEVYVLKEETHLYDAMTGLKDYRVPATCGLYWIVKLANKEGNSIDLAAAATCLKELEIPRINKSKQDESGEKYEKVFEAVSNRIGIYRGLLRGLTEYIQLIEALALSRGPLRSQGRWHASYEAALPTERDTRKHWLS